MDEHTMLGITVDALKRIRTAATDAWLEGYKVDPLYLKQLIEETLVKINKVKQR